MLLFPTPTSAPDLRDYQRRAVDSTIASLANRPILVAPTGAGKTVMAAALVRELSLHTLWLAHRKELVEQGADSLRRLGLRVGVIKAGVTPDHDAQVQVASVQTMVRRSMPSAALIVIDECHHATGDTYGDILANYPGSYVVGLTATPFRLDGRGLGDLFGEIVVSAYADELIRAGFLHLPRVWSPSSPDLRGVKATAGDFNVGAVAERANTEELRADIVRTWQQRAAGRRTVAFAVNVEHSQEIVAAFRAAGVAAEHLDGGTHPDERAAILARLRAGATHVVSNCMVLTEGWDLPALECAIIARPTASLNLHLQMVGRVMRACDGKDGAIVLDHAGNHHVHGMVSRRLTYSLDGSHRVGESEPLGLRRCGRCGLMFPSASMRCPECKAIPAPPKRKRPEIGGDGELSAFDDSTFDYRRQVWNSIEAEREAMGYKPGWSLFRYEERFGAKPATVDIDGRRDLIDTRNATMEQKKAVYSSLLSMARSRGLKDGFAAHKFKELFGTWPRGFVGEVRDRDRIGEAWGKAMSMCGAGVDENNGKDGE